MSDTVNSELTDYELAFLIADENSSFLKELLSYRGASGLNERPLQKIRLAYPIRKTVYAFMGVFNFGLERGGVGDLEAALKLQKNLLRYALTRVTMKAGKTATEAAAYNNKAREERRRTVFIKEPVKPSGEALTNEALEKKIEEILK